jgi:L-arabinokinase
MKSFKTTVASLRDSGTFFGRAHPIYIGRAPGRLDLMGGNDDYTGGLVFEATIREATWAAVQVRDDDRILFSNPQMAEHGWRDSVEFSLSNLVDVAAVKKLVNQEPSIRWTSYVLGVFYLLKQRYPFIVTTGANVFIHSEVPLNKGVSSSAAIEVAVMKTAAYVYGIELEGVELAEACQWVENVIADSACGIMDQIAVVLGDEGYILPLVCQPCLPEPLVRLPEDLQCWGIDSGVKHAVTGLEYETARAAAFMGYKMICDWEDLPVEKDETSAIPRWTDPRWNGYLANLTRSIFRYHYEPRLPEEIRGSEFLRDGRGHVDPFTPVRPQASYFIRANTRYAVEENQRVQLFAELARGAGEISSDRAFVLMGDLMYQSHYAYTECGLGAKETDTLVELVRAEGPANGLYGAKITGGGAGGTVAVLGRNTAGEAFERVVQKYSEKQGIKPYVFEGSSIGADRFGVIQLEES